MNDIISLDVGGTIFKTTRATLTSAPESMLARMFALDSELAPARVTEDGAYFLDACPRLFAVILNWLRHRKVLLGKDVSAEEVLLVVEFYGINDLKIVLEDHINDLKALMEKRNYNIPPDLTVHQVVEVCEGDAEWNVHPKKQNLIDYVKDFYNNAGFNEHVLNEGLCSCSGPYKTLIFVENNWKAEELTNWLRRVKGWTLDSIHSDKHWEERDSVLQKFNATGSLNHLVVTDVSIRNSINMENVFLVINYDFPDTIEEYIERISCAGRKGKCGGSSYTLFTPEDAHNAKDLVAVLEETGSYVPEDLVELVELVKKQSD